MRLKKFVLTIIAISLIAKTGFYIKGKLFATERSELPSDNEVTIATEDISKEEVVAEETTEDVMSATLNYEKDLLMTSPMAGKTFNGYSLESNTHEEWRDSFQADANNYERDASIYYLGEEGYYSMAVFDIAVGSFNHSKDSWGQLSIEVSEDGKNWMPIYESERLTLLSLPMRNVKALIPSGSKYLKIQPKSNDYFYFVTDKFVIS